MNLHPKYLTQLLLPLLPLLLLAGVSVNVVSQPDSSDFFTSIHESQLQRVILQKRSYLSLITDFPIYLMCGPLKSRMEDPVFAATVNEFARK